MVYRASGQPASQLKTQIPTLGSLVSITATVTLLFLSSSSPVAAEDTAPYGEIRKNIAYKDSGDLNKLDLYFPQDSQGPHPTHIFLHGGGWTGGSKGLAPMQAGVFEKLAEAGFLGIAVGYRLVDEKQDRFMRTCVVDCMDAIRYVSNHAGELGVDTERVYIWGDSAGGHLALLCANAPEETFPGDIALLGQPLQFQSVLAWYPPTDMLDYEAISVEFNHELRDLSKRLGRKLEEDPVAFIEISPLAHLTKSDPPALLIHGDSDRIVNLEHSTRYLMKAQTLGVPVELRIIRNADHVFLPVGQPIIPGKDVILETSARYFIDHATSAPKPMPEENPEAE